MLSSPPPDSPLRLMREAIAMGGQVARSAFFVLLPALGVGGVLGAPVLLCLAGALSITPSLAGDGAKSKPAPLILLCAFLVVAIASSVWSPYSGSETQALKIAALSVFGLIFAAAASRTPRITLAGVVAAFAVLALLLVIEALFSLPLNRAAQPQILDLAELAKNPGRGASLMLALTWTSAATLLARVELSLKALGAAALVAAAFVSLQFGQLANAVAFAAGIIAFLVAALAPRLAIWLTSAGVLLWLWTAPFLTPVFLSRSDIVAAMPPSWQARANIWTYVCARILEQPWWGHGLDAGRAHQPEVSVHPHSASLQVWFETGLLGVVLISAAVIAAARVLLRTPVQNAWSAAAICGTVASLGIIANLSYNLWAEWWFATLILAGAAVSTLRHRPTS